MLERSGQIATAGEIRSEPFDSRPTLVDLFSGCGGFSLGAHQAGFRVAAAFDLDPVLTSSFGYNFPSTKLVLEDVSKLDGDCVRAWAGSPIVGIFGGPPCQGFSAIGRREPDDPRRNLLGHFFRLVKEVEPDFFVLENVVGLTYANARGVLDDGLKLVSERYAVWGPCKLDPAQFGAATTRPRMFVVGIHQDRGNALTENEIAVFKTPSACVRLAIGDLNQAACLGSDDGFDIWRIRRSGRASDYARSLRSSDGKFSGHRETAHTPDVVKRFRAVAPGAMDAVGRHPRLAWQGLCPTLRAGTGADRGSYQSVRPIHPEAPRVITVREAARLQGFPDCFRFHPTVWHSFRMIGNSVSPIIARAIFSAIKAKLEKWHPAAIAAE